ncbi:MAG: AIPR family protein [Oscillatoriaceae bacterium SKW80]|nr:AIPR family protein [Oscillatoriaceae bacterium SKW80]
MTAKQKAAVTLVWMPCIFQKITFPESESQALIRAIQSLLAQAHVLLRLYQLPADNEDLVQRLTCATKSQNPVDEELAGK